MAKVIRPFVATGPGWQYQLERDGQFTDWVDWDEDFEFSQDPDGGDIRIDTTYWLYARNALLPVIEAGSFERPQAASLQVNAHNRVVPVSPAGVVTEGAAYLMELVNRTCADDLNVILRILFNSMDDQTQAVLCQKVSLCDLTPVNPVPNFVGSSDFIEVDTPENLPPSYVLRFDGNDCVNFFGWCVDKNHPNQAPEIRIERDGVEVDTVTATIQRNDVRDYLIAQGLIPQGTTFATYGWRYDKPSGDADGQSHTYRAFGGESDTEATSDVGATNEVTCGGTTSNPAVRIVDLWVLTAEGPTPTNDFRIAKADGTTSLSVNEGSSITVELQRRFSDNTWQAYADSKAWSLLNQPTGTAINSNGTIAVTADSITANASATIKVVILNNLEITAPLAILNQGATATNNFRIVKDDNNLTLSTTEGTDLQVKLQRQYSDNSWLDDNTARVWQATNGLPTGISMNSGTGKLTVGADTITADYALTIYATVILSGGNVEISKPATIVNVGSAEPTPTNEYMIDRMPSFGFYGENFVIPGALSQLLLYRKWSDNSWRQANVARSWSIVGNPPGVTINSRGRVAVASSVTTAQYVTAKATLAGGVEVSIQLNVSIKGTSNSDKSVTTDYRLGSGASAYKGRTSQLLVVESYYGVGGALTNRVNPAYEFALHTTVPADITVTSGGLLTVPQGSTADSISVKYRPAGSSAAYDFYTVYLDAYVAPPSAPLKVDYQIAVSEQDSSQVQAAFFVNSPVVVIERIYESNVLYIEQGMVDDAGSLAGVGYNRIGGTRITPRSTVLKHEFYKVGAQTPFFTYTPTIPASGTVARTNVYTQ
ncbi:hypothetical protein GCM10027592_29750 [Spirosoma flavus]